MEQHMGWTEENSREVIEKKQVIVKNNLKELRLRLEVNGELLTENRLHILSLPFLVLQAKLRNGELSTKTVLAAYQAKALLSNEKLCNVTEFVPQAEDWANERDCIPPSQRKSLHGIPISVKDIFDIASMDSSNGLAKNLFHPKEDHSIIIKVLLKAGAIPFCKTNVPVSCRSYSNENTIYGKTLNPYKKDRIPGGSSGGEASLISDGGSILGIGTDLCGSIRIPAYACGIFGLKSSTSRISQIGESTISRGLIGMTSASGFLARDPDAITAAMEALLSSNLMFELESEIIPLNWRKDLANNYKQLRVGYNMGNDSQPLTPGCLRAIEIAKKRMEDMGHSLIRIEFPNTDKLMDLAYKLSRPEESAILLPLVEGEIINDCWVEKIVSQTKQHVTGKLDDYLISNTQKLEFKDQLSKIWRTHQLDVVLGPVYLAPASKYEDLMLMFGSRIHITMMNLCNFTAGVVPITFENSEDQINLEKYPENTEFLKSIKKMTFGAEGMPIGVQLSALPWREEILCYAMKQLQVGP